MQESCVFVMVVVDENEGRERDGMAGHLVAQGSILKISWIFSCLMKWVTRCMVYKL